LIVQSLPEYQAQVVIEAFLRLAAWTRLVSIAHERFPDAESTRLDQPALATTLEELDALFTEAHSYLHPLAYPGARQP
jgi:hypothetical protein